MTWLETLQDLKDELTDVRARAVEYISDLIR